MSVGVEALFTSALGLQPPWAVEDVKLDVPTKRIDFEVSLRSLNENTLVSLARALVLEPAFRCAH